MCLKHFEKNIKSVINYPTDEFKFEVIMLNLNFGQ